MQCFTEKWTFAKPKHLKYFPKWISKLFLLNSTARLNVGNGSLTWLDSGLFNLTTLHLSSLMLGNRNFHILIPLVFWNGIFVRERMSTSLEKSPLGLVKSFRFWKSSGEIETVTLTQRYYTYNSFTQYFKNSVWIVCVIEWLVNWVSKLNERTIEGFFDWMEN